MEKKEHNHSGFGNGFILGLLVGVIVTLLITTKKGRELFREFTERGLDKFSDIEKKLQNTEEAYEEAEEGDDYVEPEEVKEYRNFVDEEKKSVHKEEEEPAVRKETRRKPSSPIRRFFRAKKS